MGKEGNEETQGSRSERGSSKSLGRSRKSKHSTLQSGNPDSLSTVHHKDEDKELHRCLALFDLVFYVPLRQAKHGTSSIKDLVSGSVSECDKNIEQQIKNVP